MRGPGRAGAGPVEHGPDGQGTRRGHSPFGWGEQGKLVAGRYGSRLTAPRSRAKAAITEVRQGWDHRCATIVVDDLLAKVTVIRNAVILSFR